MSPSRKPSTSCRERSQDGPNLDEVVWPFDQLVDSGIDRSKTLRITVRFIEGRGFTQAKKQAVLNSIKKERVWNDRETWEHWANVRFDEVTSDGSNIRVGFDQRDGSWSWTGQEANKHKEEITLNLGDLDSVEEPSTKSFGTILHEFGHALGMAHEHQSPLRTSNVTKAIRDHFSEYEQSYGRKLAESQMMNVVNGNEVISVSGFDPKSIMMYEITGITKEPNIKLSKLDKAFIVLNYPPDLTDYNDEATEKRLTKFKMALRDAGLEAKAGEIMHAFVDPGPVLGSPIENPPNISHRLQAVRKRFAECSRMMYLYGSNVNVSHSINATSTKQFALPGLRPDPPFGLTDPTLARQFGLTDPLRDVVKSKFFQSLVKNAVKNTLEQRGIPMKQSIPGASPTEVAKMMAAICMHDEIAHHVKAYKDDFQGGGPAVARRVQDGKDGAEEHK